MIKKNPGNCHFMTFLSTLENTLLPPLYLLSLSLSLRVSEKSYLSFPFRALSDAEGIGSTTLLYATYSSSSILQHVACVTSLPVEE